MGRMSQHTIPVSVILVVAFYFIRMCLLANALLFLKAITRALHLLSLPAPFFLLASLWSQYPRGSKLLSRKTTFWLDLSLEYLKIPL